MGVIIRQHSLCRCRRIQLLWILLLTALLVNLTITLLYYKSFLGEKHRELEPNVHKSQDKKAYPLPQYSSEAVVIIRDFEDFENYIPETVSSILSHNTNISVVVVADNIPYPPLKVPKSQYYKEVVLSHLPEESFLSSRPESFIHAPYIVTVPDGTSVITKGAIQTMISDLEKQPSDVRLMAWPVDKHSIIECLDLKVNLKQWTLQYSQTESPCSAIGGERFASVFRSSDLYNLSSPFSRPLHKALFIQTTIRGWKVAVGKGIFFQSTRKHFENPHNHWKHKTKDYTRLKALYASFGIKLVKYSDSHHEWFGCNKDTARCFGTVINSMPDYLYKGRWTPPCCLEAIRTTARHVFRIFESQQVRYWLEGGSLLGAARNGDIIPWDYDVDIGIYRDDIAKSEHLQSASSQPFVDNDGFLWQKATEGEFFRVQYSQANHLHVDIYPFYSRNGTMTKDTWMKTHRQDMEFPETFLKPLTKIPFVGVQALVPNNWKKFLELKFGEGVIENPKYNDLSNVF